MRTVEQPITSLRLIMCYLAREIESVSLCAQRRLALNDLQPGRQKN